jgi:hypothetical protein
MAKFECLARRLTLSRAYRSRILNPRFAHEHLLAVDAIEVSPGKELLRRVSAMQGAF